MKIAITSKGNTLDSEVDPRFGRAKGFIIVDSERDDFEAVNNEQNLNAAQGAGIQAAQHIVERNVEAIITGHCGPKAFRALQAAKVKIFTGAQGTVQEMLDKFKRGELKELLSPDVEGHW